MKCFFKLNIVSILYAVMIFIPLQLMVNVYRISRLTGWGIGTINPLSSIIIIFQFIFGTLLFLFLTKKWLDSRKVNYFTAILWIPYFIIFTYLFASLFPITYGGDDPNAIIGLLTIILLTVFPIYILIINFIGSKIRSD